MTKNTTPSLEDIVALEEKVWAALTSGDPAADGALLTEEFLGVYASGFSDRAGHMAELNNGPTMADHRISEARLIPLGEGRALLAYRADYRKSGGKEWEAMYISSIWERGPSGWLNSFSQDTPAE